MRTFRPPRGVGCSILDAMPWVVQADAEYHFACRGSRVDTEQRVSSHRLGGSFDQNLLQSIYVADDQSLTLSPLRNGPNLQVYAQKRKQFHGQEQKQEDLSYSLGDYRIATGLKLIFLFHEPRMGPSIGLVPGTE
jgi:hypothetical protein